MAMSWAIIKILPILKMGYQLIKIFFHKQNIIYNGTDILKGRKKQITHLWIKFLFVKSSFIDKMELKVFYLEQQQTQSIRIVKIKCCRLLLYVESCLFMLSD